MTGLTAAGLVLLYSLWGTGSASNVIALVKCIGRYNVIDMASTPPNVGKDQILRFVEVQLLPTYRGRSVHQRLKEGHNLKVNCTSNLR